MTKNVDTRLKETMDFILAHPVPNFVGSFTVLVSALNDWNNTASGSERTELSRLMSQKNATNRPGNKTDRSYRRAAIMLKCVLVVPRARWAGEATLLNKYSNRFAGVYEAGANEARDSYYSSPGMAQRYLDQLQTDPESFLRQFKLITNGKSAAGKYTYGFYMAKGAYRLDCFEPEKGQVKVDAINVPAVPYADVRDAPGNITAIRSSLDAGCTLMLTTQFTGCSYCFMVHGGELAAAHINPVKGSGSSGQDVSAAMRAHGGFSNGIGGTFKVYGRIDNNSGLWGYPQTAEQMIIVGAKSAGNWRVVAQIDMGTHRDVERIDN